MSGLYKSADRFAELYSEKSRRLGFCADSSASYAAWKASLRNKLSELIGLDGMTPSYVRAQRISADRSGGDEPFTLEKYLLETERGVFMPFWLFTPKNLRPGERRAAIITPHGHGGGGKDAVAGVKDDPRVAEAIEIYNYDYGRKLAERGYIVAAPDARGFGERRESDGGDILAGSCARLNHMALPLGRTAVGMFVFDLMRLADFMLTLDNVDGEKLGCAGLSGGGMQTLWFAALDDRVKLAAISGYFYGYLESLLRMPDNCSCNYVPHLWEYADMGDLAALIAPRPLIIESGDSDGLNGAPGLDNVYPQLEIARGAYKLLGAEQNLVHNVFSGGHRWYGGKTYADIDGFFG